MDTKRQHALGLALFIKVLHLIVDLVDRDIKTARSRIKDIEGTVDQLIEGE